jgi:hypothetical protein
MLLKGYCWNSVGPLHSIRALNPSAWYLQAISERRSAICQVRVGLFHNICVDLLHTYKEPWPKPAYQKDLFSHYQADWSWHRKLPWSKIFALLQPYASIGVHVRKQGRPMRLMCFSNYQRPCWSRCFFPNTWSVTVVLHLAQAYTPGKTKRLSFWTLRVVCR